MVSATGMPLHKTVFFFIVCSETLQKCRSYINQNNVWLRQYHVVRVLPRKDSKLLTVLTNDCLIRAAPLRSIGRDGRLP